MDNPQEKWVQVLQEHNAWWIYSGDPNTPHALLTSGHHSDGYINSRIIFEQSDLLEAVADDLLKESKNGSRDILTPSSVVGLYTGGAQLGEVLARKLSVPFFPARIRKDGPTANVEIDNKIANSKECVLLVDDVISTFSTLQILRSHLSLTYAVQWHPIILAFANRSGRVIYGNQIVYALVNRFIRSWENKEVCPLCAANSQAVRLKEEWPFLVGTPHNSS